MEDLDDLARDARLIKKFRAGKVRIMNCVKTILIIFIIYACLDFKRNSEHFTRQLVFSVIILFNTKLGFLHFYHLGHMHDYALGWHMSPW